MYSCEFGNLVEAGSVDAFDIAYLRHQVAFSHEEIGDQTDNCPDVPVRILSITDPAEDPSYLPIRAYRIAYCLEQRYLGNCALYRCSGAKRVAELLETVAPQES